MPLGAGRYDALCSEAREKAHALGAMLIIFSGVHGDGFSAQLAPELTRAIPAILRYMADEIEASFTPPPTGVH